VTQLGLTVLKLRCPSEDSKLFTFTRVSLVSGVVVRGDLGVLGTDKIIEQEPHNLLLDAIDDPSIPGPTAEEAQVALYVTLEEFSDVFLVSCTKWGSRWKGTTSMSTSSTVWSGTRLRS
jgi:hypothetical protein